MKYWVEVNSTRSGNQLLPILWNRNNVYWPFARLAGASNIFFFLEAL